MKTTWKVPSEQLGEKCGNCRHWEAQVVNRQGMPTKLGTGFCLIRLDDKGRNIRKPRAKTCKLYAALPEGDAMNERCIGQKVFFYKGRVLKSGEIVGLAYYNGVTTYHIKTEQHGKMVMCHNVKESAIKKTQ